MLNFYSYATLFYNLLAAVLQIVHYVFGRLKDKDWNNCCTYRLFCISANSYNEEGLGCKRKPNNYNEEGFGCKKIFYEATPWPSGLLPAFSITMFKCCNCSKAICLFFPYISKLTQASNHDVINMHKHQSRLLQ